jgi:hypothetical protein
LFDLRRRTRAGVGRVGEFVGRCNVLTPPMPRCSHVTVVSRNFPNVTATLSSPAIELPGLAEQLEAASTDSYLVLGALVGAPTIGEGASP